MKCPYMKSIETHVQIWTQHHDDDPDKTAGGIVDQWYYELMDCLKCDCAAWYDGRCHYNDR